MFKKLIIMLVVTHQMLGMENNNNDQELQQEETCVICAEPLWPIVQVCLQKHFLHVDCYAKSKKKWKDRCPVCMGATIVYDDDDKNNDNNIITKSAEEFKVKAFRVKYLANQRYDFIDKIRGKDTDNKEKMVKGVNELCEELLKKAEECEAEKERAIGNNESLQYTVWQVKKDKEELRLQIARIQENTKTLRENNRAMERTITNLSDQLEQERRASSTMLNLLARKNGEIRDLEQRVFNLQQQAQVQELPRANNVLPAENLAQVDTQLKKENSNYHHLTKIKNILSGAVNYYALVGMGALLSAVSIQRALGFVEFQHTSVAGVAGDLAVIATSGYCAALLGVGFNKGIKYMGKILNKVQLNPDVYIDWLLPTMCGIMGGLIAGGQLGKINDTARSEKYAFTAAAIFMTSTYLSGVTMHYTYQKLYGDLK